MGKYSILLVDDSEDERELTSDFIKQLGHKVETASDGFAALSYLEKEADGVDLVITDVRMPKMDGLELLKRIGQNFPHIPVALLTGAEDLSMAVEAIRLTAFDFLQKTYEATEIESLLKRFTAFREASTMGPRGLDVNFEETVIITSNRLEQTVTDITGYISNRYHKTFQAAGINPHRIAFAFQKPLITPIVSASRLPLLPYQ